MTLFDVFNRDLRKEFEESTYRTNGTFGAQQIYTNEELANVKSSFVNYDTYTPELFQKLLGKKWKVSLERLLPVFNYLDHYNKEKTAVYLSTKGGKIKTQMSFPFRVEVVYNKHKKVYTKFNILKDKSVEKVKFERDQKTGWEIIQDLKALSLIGVIDGSYRHISSTSTNTDNDGTYPMTYWLNKHNFDSLRKLIENYSIETPTPTEELKETTLLTGEDVSDINDEWVEKDGHIFFVYKGELVLPKTPLMKLREELKKEMSVYQDDIFTYHLPNGKCRPYSKFCSNWKTKKNEHKEVPAEYREDVLDRYFNNNWYEWDRTSSIYNVTATFRKGLLNNNDKDLYESFMGRPFVSKEERKEFKTLMMSIYFGDVRKFRYLIEETTENLLRYYKDNDLNNYNKKERKGINTALNNKERVFNIFKFANVDLKNDCNETLIEKCVEWFKQVRKNMKKTIGAFYKNYEIFILEGLVNIKTENKLNNYGIKCVSVYDGLYMDKSKYTETELETICWNFYKESVKEVKDLLNK